MSTRIRLTRLAILIPGIILGLILAGQATPAMAESPDNERGFGFSLGLKDLLPPPELVPKQSPGPGSSQSSITNTRNNLGNNPPPPQQSNTGAASTSDSPPQQANTRVVTSVVPPRADDVVRPGSTEPKYVNCNALMDWPHTSGWLRDDGGVRRDVGAFVHVGYYGHDGNTDPDNAICVQRFNTVSGWGEVLCSRARATNNTLQDAGYRLDVNSTGSDLDFTGHYTLSGQAICSTAEAIQSHQEYVREQQRKQHEEFCRNNPTHTSCTP